MVKPEWGTKRTCPKCATRFYDLGKDEPVTCIECGVDACLELDNGAQPERSEQGIPRDEAMIERTGRRPEPRRP